MKDQIELLMVLQDLDQLIQAAEDRSTADFEKKLGFVAMDGLGRLKKKRQNVASKVEASILAHYNKLAQRYDQPLVPMVDSICMGCFIRQPTGGKIMDGESIPTCESCKRILYQLKV